MSFLCQNHHAQLRNDADRAQSSWHLAIARARHAVLDKAWDKAVMYYGNALEITEIRLTHHREKAALEDYIRTSVEMMHAVRNSTYQRDSEAFYEMIVDKVDGFANPAETGYRLQPLADVAFESLDQVNEWMSQWHQWPSEASMTVH